MAGLEDDITIIKSLIAISKGGLPVHKIRREYLDINGSHLNFQKYGFNSLEAMLESSRDIVLRRTPDGIVCHVNDNKMSHVTSLVDRTRKKVGKPKKKRFCPRAYSSSRGYSSSQQYGYRTGGSPFREQRKQSFQPVNGMAPRRTQTFSRSYCESRPVSRSSAVRPNDRQIYQDRRREPQRNYVPEPRYNSSTRSTAPLNFGRSGRDYPDSRPVQFPSVSSSANISAKDKVISDDWSSDSSVPEQQHSKPISKSSSGDSWGSKPSDARMKGGALNSGHSLSLKPTVRKQFSAAKPIVSNLINRSISRKVHSDGPSSSKMNVTTKKSKPVSSDSEWSSDSGIDSAVQCGYERNTRPSGSKGSVPSRSKVHQSADQPRINSLPASQIYPRLSPPLMTGGVGRGKMRSQAVSNRPSIEVTRRHQTINVNQSTEKEHGLIVTGSPAKRETMTISRNKNTSILVKVSFDSSSNPVEQSRTEVLAPLPVGIPLPRRGMAGADGKAQDFYAEPSYCGFQFIGDHFLLKVAEVCLGTEVKTNGWDQFCGLCQTSYTIPECQAEIMRKRTSSKIVMMIGMTDILEGASLELMKVHTLHLLQALEIERLVLMTIPIPPSFIRGWNETKLAIVENYNNWLLQSQFVTGQTAVIDTNNLLLCDWTVYAGRVPPDAVETFTEDGCWAVMDAILDKIK